MEHLDLRVVVLQLSDNEGGPADLVTVHVLCSLHTRQILETSQLKFMCLVFFQMLRCIVCYSETVCSTIIAQRSRCRKGLITYSRGNDITGIRILH